jgi:hypothetical protein
VKKIILISLVLVLLSAFVMPALLISPSAHADSPAGTTKMGPMLIGVKSGSHNYAGIGASLYLSGPELIIPNIKSFSLDGTWSLSLRWDIAPAKGVDFVTVTGGTLSRGWFSSTLPKGKIVGGYLGNLAQMKPEMDGNFLVYLQIDTNNDGGTDLEYAGMLLGNVSALVPYLPQMLQGMQVPSCITNLVNRLMPILNSSRQPLSKLPPIMIIMPTESFSQLYELFAPIFL